ncbi:hypothetical protein D3OALGA1CA_4943 [Olavius algarvensis associated proteobacterium Delta 3]|nr:hypothetical protein D3OALGA1CA_4943 [Olavius algarvensis associated proteobacterium Delta 3]
MFCAEAATLTPTNRILNKIRIHIREDNFIIFSPFLNRFEFSHSVFF